MTIYLQWLSDGALVKRALSGNRDAFGALVERHLAMAHALAWGHTGNPSEAEDIAQEAFIKAFTKLDTLRERNKFAGWLAGIVRNLAADARARAARAEFLSEDALANAAAPGVCLEDEEIYALLRDAIAQLEESAREVLSLHYFAKKPLREVAELQGISREAAMKRLQRAREALGKQLLGKLEGAPRPARRLEARKSAILALVATAPFAWKAAAATGVSSAAIAAVVALISFLSVLGYAKHEYGGGWWGAEAPVQEDPGARGHVTSTAPAEIVAAPVVAATVAPATQAAGIDGNGRIHGRVMDVAGNPVAKATVRLEKVSWDAASMPPAETLRFEFITDATGAFSAENLPFGDFSLLAFNANTIDVLTSGLNAETFEREENFYLKPGLPVAGRVVDKLGKPVPGAILEPHAYGPLGTINDHVVTSAVRVMSDDSGNFRIGLIWPGTWQFMARAEGYAASVTGQIEAGTQNAIVTLLGGGKVTGTITQVATGAPAPGIRVRLQGYTGAGVSPSAESDETGAFTLLDVTPGTYQVNIETELVAIAEGPKEIIVESGKEIPLDLVIGGGASVSGRVFLTETGEGIADVRVNINSYGAGNVYREVKTDAAGSFFFPVLPEGAYNVNPYSSDGYFQAQQNHNVNVVVSGEREIEINFGMLRGLKLSGKVVDVDGAPVGEASINCNFTAPNADFPDNSYADADKEGAFTAWVRPGAKDIKISASHGHRYSKSQSVPPPTASGASGIVLTLSGVADSSVEAKVDVRGLEQYVAAQMLEAMLSSRGGDRSFGDTVRVAPNGDAIFKNVPAGQYVIMVQQRNYGMQLCESQPFDVPAGKVVSGIELPCAQTGELSITGRVVADSGEPIADAEIFISNGMMDKTATVKSALDGSFVVENLKEGRHSLSIVATGYTPRGTSAEAGGPEVVIQLSPARVVRGRVRDAATGEPIKSFQVTARPDSGGQNTINYAELFQGGGHPFNSPDGTFVLDYVGQHHVFVVVVAPGYSPTGQPSPVDDDREIEFLLKQGQGVSGVVTTPEGAPLSAVKVSLAAPTAYAQPDAATTSTDIDGAYALKGGEVLPGLTLHFFHPNYAITQRVVPADGRLDVAMETGGVLAGRVAPAPTKDQRYYLRYSMRLQSGQDTNGEEIPVNPDGSFRKEGLPTGTATLNLLDREYLSPNSYTTHSVAQAEVEILNGQTIEVLLEVESPQPPQDAPADSPEDTVTPEGPVVPEVPVAGEDSVAPEVPEAPDDTEPGIASP